jgi:hypothetical protein
MSNEQPVVQVDASVEDKQDMVKYETFQKVLSEKKNYQAQFNEMKASLDQLMAEKEAAEQQKLIERNEFKALYEREAASRKRAEELLEGVKKNAEDTEKRKAVLTELGLKREEFLSFVDLNAIPLVDGRVDEAALKSYAADFKAKFPELVVEHKAPPPTGRAPAVNGSPAAYDTKDPKAIMEA